MRVIYTPKGMSKKFGVRVIYRKIRYLGLAENALNLSSEICDVQDFNIFRQMKVNEMMLLELYHCHIIYIIRYLSK